MQITQLQRENTELKQNEIDEGNYEQWTWRQILKWILSLNNGQYERYQSCLAQHLEQAQVKGSDLRLVNEIDLKSWGVIVFADMKSLKHHFDRLSHQNNDEEFELEGVQSSIM